MLLSEHAFRDNGNVGDGASAQVSGELVRFLA
jgi:hypothetical protein